MHLSSGIATVTIALLAVGTSSAAPPPNANPAFSDWFNSLVDPDLNVSCCSRTDCRTVEDRMARDHFEVRVGDRWLSVPPDKVLHRTDNPTGQAVLCWSKVLGILCFVPGAGT